MRRWDAVSVGCFDRGMPLKPREMSGAGIPGRGVPSWVMLAVPALASAWACVIAAHVRPGATRAGSTGLCANAGAGIITVPPTNQTIDERVISAQIAAIRDMAGESIS